MAKRLPRDAAGEAEQLKSLAEEKYENSDLVSALNHAKRVQKQNPNLGGLSAMVTALKILRVAEEPIGELGSPDWYKILQIDPFSSVNAVKKRYKKLALALHPDKSSFVGCGDAFKLVADAFRCLDDRERKKEFDLKLRVRIQDERMRREEEVVERFWTRCVGCGMLHKFEKKYVGQNLMCTGCRKSFMAVEIEGNDDSDITLSDNEEEEEEEDEVEEGKESEVKVSGPDDRDAGSSQNWKGKIIVYSRRKVSEKSSEASDVRRCNVSQKSSGGEIRSERLKAKRMKLVGEEMTLAELQLQAKQRKKVLEKMTVEKTVADKCFDTGKRKEEELQGVCLRVGSHEHVRKSVDLIHEIRNGSKKSDTANAEQDCEEDVLWLSALKKKKAEIAKSKSTSKKRSQDVEDVESGRLEGDNFEIMTVEDSDFYDFDKDRVEKSFKHGQVWAVYDDEDGMPRHYGLIDQVVSTYPFEVKMSWLDPQTNSYEMLPISATSQSRVSCGRFKVDKKTVINSVNFFSHVVNFDRATREVYSIYPKKGSVWALYNDEDVDIYGREGVPNRSFSIVVFLTSYSEMHGLSMAYLKKVNGLKTVFRRPEIGCGAVIWLEKVDVRLFSHQIPARKLSEVEAPKHLKDCWELDPASLPPEHPLSLEELKVVTEDAIEVDDDQSYVRVTFTPTMQHRSLSPTIGLCLRVELMRSLPSRFKVAIRLAPGTLATEAAGLLAVNVMEFITITCSIPSKDFLT